MSTDQSLAAALATAFLQAQLVPREAERLSLRVLGRRSVKWLPALVERAVAKFPQPPLPLHAELTRFIRNDFAFQRAIGAHSYFARPLLCGPPELLPAAAAADWRIPPLRSSRELASWLGVSPSQLDAWTVRARWRVTSDEPRRQHYLCRPIKKRAGGWRMLEAPKPRLKRAQRQILADILDRIPPHEAAHGFVVGRSIFTFAAPHVAQDVVLRLDLSDFFPSITQGRILGIFRWAGYPELVARRLTSLCTHTTPASEWPQELGRHEMARMRRLFGSPHLPQGAPTSPSLANLVSYRLDLRLTALALSADAVYTRYGDDLAFSGSDAFRRGVESFRTSVAAIVMEEGFTVNFRKTRVLRQGVCQRLTGLVVNQTLNVSRRQYDELKAILTNCRRLGAASQNRAGVPNFRAHLDGRLAFIELVHPSHGQKLRRIWEEIEW